MTEHDFFDALSHRREYYAFAKKAAPDMKGVVEMAKHPVVLGAFAGIGLQYLANLRDKTGKSFQRKSYERASRVAQSDVAEAKREGRKPGFGEETRAVTAPALARLAEIAERHPFKAALPAALPGAGIGAAIARALK